MTVVVPPAKGGKTPTVPEESLDANMTDGPAGETKDTEPDQVEKAVAGKSGVSCTPISSTNSSRN